MDVTAHSQDGRTALHLASRASFGYTDITRILIEYGTSATAQGNNRQSPLHVVSSYRNAVVARSLVEWGADMTAQDNNGRTPLHYASSCGGMEVAHFLVERSANATA